MPAANIISAGAGWQVIEKDLEKSLPLMKRRFGCALTAATLGEDGVLAWDGKQFHFACAYQVAAVDTTGAGDTFNGALAVAIAEGEELQKAIHFANIAAGLSVTKLGAQGGMPLRDKLREVQMIVGW